MQIVDAPLELGKHRKCFVQPILLEDDGSEIALHFVRCGSECHCATQEALGLHEGAALLRNLTEQGQGAGIIPVFV